MDIFYKPPESRNDECQALEENYMNCLLQKALKDRTNIDRCNLDSVLWFHLECPRSVAKFDDPMTFKSKVRDWFADLRHGMKVVSDMSEEDLKLQKEFGTNAYPEDIKNKPEILKFQEEFDKHSAILTPEDEDMDEEDDEFDESPEDDEWMMSVRYD